MIKKERKLVKEVTVWPLLRIIYRHIIITLRHMQVPLLATLKPTEIIHKDLSTVESIL